ncbi:MAG: DUF3883 domain-containing protein [Desulfobacterales bacterium]|nr:DUF3883 domain-containing protein [Desulfobacterales bacterium]
MASNKHEHYYALNLMGYGLAKFDMEFVEQMGFFSKQDFYRYVVDIGIAKTSGVVKNRQDLFDPFFDNKRKGWWQKGDTYIHRKIYIDSLFGDLGSEAYANVVSLHLNAEFLGDKEVEIKPILKSRFKQLQCTGREAELYFIQNFSSIQFFQNGLLEDARLYGDGYDFQIQVESHYYLAEVKGVRFESGSVRMTEKEFEKAKEYKEAYALSVVSNLYEKPRINIVFDPVSNMEFTTQITESTQLSYHSKPIDW